MALHPSGCPQAASEISIYCCAPAAHGRVDRYHAAALVGSGRSATGRSPRGPAAADPQALLEVLGKHVTRLDRAVRWQAVVPGARDPADATSVLLEDRIRAHVLLRSLALLMVRVVETRATTPAGSNNLSG